MAEEKDDIEVVPANGNKTKLLLIALGVLVLIMAGVVGWLLMGNDDTAPEEQAEQAEVVHQAPIYFTVEAPFIINFSEQSNNAVKYMQVKMKVMARSQAVIDAFQLHLPAIQHEILMLLYSQKYDDLLTSDGTKALQQACLDTINKVLKQEESLENELEAVYFTSFIMQ